MVVEYLNCIEEITLLNQFTQHFKEYYSTQDGKDYPKTVFRQAFKGFTELNSKVSGTISFAVLLLLLKQHNLMKAVNRDHLRWISEENRSNINVPELASNSRFFVFEIKSAQNLSRWVKDGIFAVQESLVESLNIAFSECDQVVGFVNLNERITYFFTMDTSIIPVSQLDSECNPVDTEGVENLCFVSWEAAGDVKIPRKTSFEVKKKKAEIICKSLCGVIQNDSTFQHYEEAKSDGTINKFDIDDGSKVSEKKENTPNECTVVEFKKEEPSLALWLPSKTGVVVKFSQQKGYGFIRPDIDEAYGLQLPDIFVHRTSIVSSSNAPNLRVGQQCEYDVTCDPRTMKPHAVNVTGPNKMSLDEINMSGYDLESSKPNGNYCMPPQQYGHNISQRKIRCGKKELNAICTKDVDMTVTISNDGGKYMQDYAANSKYYNQKNLQKKEIRSVASQRYHQEHPKVNYDNLRQYHYGDVSHVNSMQYGKYPNNYAHAHQASQRYSINNRDRYEHKEYQPPMGHCGYKNQRNHYNIHSHQQRYNKYEYSQTQEHYGYQHPPVNYGHMNSNQYSYC